MTTAERVGQLFMIGIGAHGATSAELARLSEERAGNVYLAGRSSAGRARTAHVSGVLRGYTSYAGVSPFVGTDQEGGEVQVLSGPGFDSIPTALTQGTYTTAQLVTKARRWGGQLRAAGVNLDLAPVADIVPSSVGTRNQPIGQYYREYGYTARRVDPHVGAFVDGMGQARVVTAVKHFPSLGRASGNTDNATYVTDPTSPHSGYLRPFKVGIDHHTAFVMVSSAVYPHIDRRHRACFSRIVITTLLRGTEGFRGVVVSDSFSARSVSPWSPGQRALQFIDAGGTMILDSSSAHLRPMISAVRAQIVRSRTFARLVRAAVLTVLTAKARAGLIR